MTRWKMKNGVRFKFESDDGVDWNPAPMSTFEISPTGHVRMLKESGKVNKNAVARTRKFMGKVDTDE